MSLKELGFKTAQEFINGFANLRVYYIEPLSLALTTGRRDPITGLPGIESGTIVEFAGGAGKLKTAYAEIFTKHVLDADPYNEVAYLNFECPDHQRWGNLLKNGSWDSNRVLTMDYSNPKLKNAENGLDLLLAAAQEPSCKLCVIDSFGAMAMEKEIKDDKGEYKPMDANKQNTLRAFRIKGFLERWETLNPITRPILMILNHMYTEIDMGGFGTNVLEANKIGKDLNYMTSGGKAIHYHADMRIRCDAKKWPDTSSAEIHEYSKNKYYDSLEAICEVYKNKKSPGRKWSRAVYNMEDRANCHFDQASEVLEICNYLEVGDITRKNNRGWYILGKHFSNSEAREYLELRPELIKELIIECAKPGNPEKFHTPKSKHKDNDL